MSDIFISYSRDDRSRVEPLANALEAQGWSVWWDLHISPSEIWARVIDREIGAAKCVVVVWSNKSVSSEWVLIEADEGANRKILVPVLIESAKIPLEFRRIQAANLIGWQGTLPEAEFDRLVTAVTRLAGPPPGSQSLAISSELKSPLSVPPVLGPNFEESDWLDDAQVFPSDIQERADDAWRNMYQREELDGNELYASETGAQFWDRKKEFWFDYISSTGDSMLGTYSIAYLCLSRLWKKAKPDENDTALYLGKEVKDNQNDLALLPRGEFLLVGWRTRNYLSRFLDPSSRLQVPFEYAYQDLEVDLKNIGERIDDEKAHVTGRNRRPLFGIPANRYQETPDAFRKQFFAPPKNQPENEFYPDDYESPPQLMIPGFKRFQKTTYIALRLPFSWMLWGLDVQAGTIDAPQRYFFLGTNGGRPPEKLIVGTGRPTTVFGKYCDRDAEPSKAFYQLKLPRPFLPAEKMEDDEKSRLLNPDQIRLDLGSDVHQYARYWGPTNGTGPRTRSETAGADAPSLPNYASVVSGLGGTFHDPSTTYGDEIKEQALYPSEERSRRAVAARLFNPWAVARGGPIALIGGVVAMVLAFAAITGDSSRPAIHNFLPFTLLGITSSQQYQSTILVDRELQLTIPIGFSQQLGIPQAQWNPSFPRDQQCIETQPMYLWGKCSVVWPRDYSIGTVMLLFTVVITGFTFYRTEQAYALDKKQDEVKKKAAKAKDATEQPTKEAADGVTIKVNRAIWLTSAANIMIGILGLLLILPYRAFIPPFGNSIWLLLTIIWAIASVVLSVRYNDWLTKQTSKRKIDRFDYAIIWVLALWALTSLFAGLSVFGKGNLPADSVLDIAFIAVVVGSLVLLINAAVSIGGQFQKGLGKLGMGVLGFWHWLLHVTVAVFLIYKGTWLTVALALAVILSFSKLGTSLLRASRRWALVIAWLVFGSIMLALPPLVYQVLHIFADQEWAQSFFFPYFPHDYGQARSFAAYEWWGSMRGWSIFVPIALAFGFGALFSCVWVGWYLAVCLGFNGHNHETGRVARIQQFNQFIRFRLTENDLTGYVIAVDEPKAIGSELTPKIIDVFHLRRSGS